MEACPDGTSQIGARGDSFDENNFISFTKGKTLQECKALCDGNSECVGFQFDSDKNKKWFPKKRASYDMKEDNGCSLYNNTVLGDPVRFTARDLILCVVNPPTSEPTASPPLYAHAPPDQYLDFEAITNEAGKEATTTTEISVYIIYGVIGLVLVNIICLVVHCWMKHKNGKGKRYKVVSIGSEDDSTDV